MTEKRNRRKPGKQLVKGMKRYVSLIFTIALIAAMLPEPMHVQANSTQLVPEGQDATYGQLSDPSVIANGDYIQYSFAYMAPAGLTPSYCEVYFQKGAMKSSCGMETWGFAVVNYSDQINGKYVTTSIPLDFNGDYKVWCIRVTFADQGAEDVYFYDCGYFEGHTRYVETADNYCVVDLSALSYQKNEVDSEDTTGPSINVANISFSSNTVVSYAAVDLSDNNPSLELSVPMSDNCGIAEWFLVVTDGQYVRAERQDSFSQYGESLQRDTTTAVGKANPFIKRVGSYQILYILAYDKNGNETAIYDDDYKNTLFVQNDYMGRLRGHYTALNQVGTGGIKTDLSGKTYYVSDSNALSTPPTYDVENFSVSGKRFCLGDEIQIRTPINGHLTEWHLCTTDGYFDGMGNYADTGYEAHRFGTMHIDYVNAEDSNGRKSILINSEVYPQDGNPPVNTGSYDKVYWADLSAIEWTVGLKDTTTGLMASNEDFVASGNNKTTLTVEQEEMTASNQAYQDLKQSTNSTYDEETLSNYTDKFFWDVTLQNYTQVGDKKIKVWIPVPGIEDGGQVLVRHKKHDDSIEFFDCTVAEGLVYLEMDDFSPILVSYLDGGTPCPHTHTEIRNSSGAGCTTYGYSGDTYCKDCGEKLSEGYSVSPYGHSYTRESVTKEADCLNAGEKMVACSRCGDSHTEVIPALGHDYQEEIIKEPSKTETGEKRYTCSRCNDTYTELIPKIVDPDHVHSYKGTLTKNPNCTEAGERIYTCTCGLFYTETIPALGHQFGPWMIVIAPTTFMEGEEERYCIECAARQTRSIDKTEPTRDDQRLLEDAGKGGVKDETKPVLDEEGKEVGQETVITVGGQVVEKVTVDESGEVKVESMLWTGGFSEGYNYRGSSVKADFRLYDGTKKLVEGEDFVLKYSHNKKVGEKAGVTIIFKGDYKGTPDQSMEYMVEPAQMGSDVLATDTALAANGKKQTPMPPILWAESGKKIGEKNFSCTYRKMEALSLDTLNGTDEALEDDKEQITYHPVGEELDGVTEPGIYEVTVKPVNGEYTGTLTARITVVGDKKLLLSEADVSLNTKQYTWTGQAIVPAAGSYALTLNGTKLTEGTDYTVSCSNNVDPGKATITFTAVEGNPKGYAGSKDVTFSIMTGREIKKEDGFSFIYDESVPYAKGGATPAIVVKDGETILTAGSDYTVSYQNNKGVTNGKSAELIVKGKGKYKGSVSLSFEITKQSMEALSPNVVVADKSISKKGYRNPSVTITDLNGKKLKAGTDYAIDPVSYSEGEDGKITMDIVGKGKDYEGRITVSYRYIESSKLLGKVKANKLKNKVYYGREIRLTNADFANILYTGSKKDPTYLVPGEDFVVVCYSGNTKTGKAKVTVKGIGTYGGTKTLTFQITAKKASFISKSDR